MPSSLLQIKEGHIEPEDLDDGRHATAGINIGTVRKSRRHPYQDEVVWWGAKIEVHGENSEQAAWLRTQVIEGLAKSELFEITETEKQGNQDAQQEA